MNEVQRDLGTIWSTIGLDYRPFEMGIAHVQRRIRELDASNQAHFDQLSRAWSQVGQELPRPFDVATAQIEGELDQLVTASEAGAQRLGQVWEQTGSGLYVPFSESADKIETSAEQVEQALEDVARVTEEVSEAARQAGDTVEHSVAEMGAHWQRLGAVLSLSVTAPLTVAGTVMVRTFSDFSASMARTAAVSQATRSEWERMTGVARELGATTRYSASQAADGMTFLAMAGFGVNQTIAAMPGVLQLAASAQLDLATAADIATNILTGYGLAVEELARVNDVLVSAMTGANTNLQQLGEAMKYAGPVASAAGIQFEEAAAALALMGNAGIQGSMAGTSLRGALTHLLNPTAQNARLIRELGLNLYDTSGNLRSLIEIVEELERKSVSAGDMMALFGQRAGPAMQALVDQGSQALRQFHQRLLESEGIAARVATTQEDTLQGSILELESAYEELALSLTSSVEPALRRTIDTLANMIRVVAALPEPVQQGAVAFGVAVAAAGPLILAFRALATAAAPLLGPAGIVLGLAAALGTLAAAYGYVQERARAASAAGIADHIERTLEHARATREQINELDRLIARYNALAGKPEKSADEHEELRKVIDQIVALAPDAITGYDEMGRALIGNADAARYYREELAKTLEMTLELTAEEARIRIPYLEAEIERKRAELEAVNAQAQDARDKWLQAVASESQFSIEVFRQLYEYRQAEAADLAAEVRTLLEDLNRLQVALARLEAFRRGEEQQATSRPASSMETIAHQTVETQESLLKQEIRIWQDRIAATREGTAEQRRIIEAFLKWVNEQIGQIDVNPFVGVMGLDEEELQRLATLRPLQTQLAAMVAEMEALDRIALITSEHLGELVIDDIDDITARWQRRLQLLNNQRIQLEVLERRAQEMGTVGEGAARRYREALTEVNSEIREMERTLEAARKEAADSFNAQLRAIDAAVRETQRAEEARIERQLRELELQREIRRILGEPMTPSEELHQIQEFLEYVREHGRTKIEIEYTFEGSRRRGTARALSQEFIAELERRLNDEIALLEAQLSVRPTATLTLGPVAAIMDEYERRLQSLRNASGLVDGFNFLQEAINLTNQTLMRLAEEGLDVSDAAVQRLRENLELFQRLAAFPARPTVQSLFVLEPDAIDRRIDEMYEALRQADVQAIAFGDSFDLVATKARIVRSALNDVIRLGIDPADMRFRHLLATLAMYEEDVGPVTRVLDELSRQLTINSQMAEVLGEVFDRDRADVSAYQRALETLAKESLQLTGDELEEAVYWMRVFGEEIRLRTLDTERWRRVQERLGSSLLDVVRTGGDSLGSYLGQVWQTAKDEGISFVEAISLSVQGVMANTGALVTFVVDGIMQSIRAVRDAYDRLDQRAKESADRNADLRRRFDELTRMGFSGSFELDAKRITEQVQGGVLTSIGQWLGLVPREVSRTIYETSKSTEEWIERMEQLFQEAADAGRSAMRDTFEDPEIDFLTSLRMSVYDHVRSGLIDAFSESQVYMRAMAPLFQAIDQAMEQAFAGGTFDEAVFNRIVDPAIARWEQDIRSLERPFERIQETLDRVRRTLDIPGPYDETAGGGSSGGVRLTNLTGASRDFLAEHLRPLRLLDLAPMWHEQHMARLDAIISLLGGHGELTAQFRSYLEVQQAILHSETVIVEIIQSATFTGPIGNVIAQIGEEDAREVVRQIMDRLGFGGSALARAEGN